MSIYSEIGGSSAVQGAVELFYGRVLADPSLSPYFDGVDLRRLSTHQRAFLAAALGGPDLYAGRDLTRAHTHLSIDDAAFDRVVEHLAGTLVELGVPDETIRAIAERIEPLRAQIVTRTAALAGGRPVPVH